MIIYSETGEIIETPNLANGWIETKTSETVKEHHPAIPIKYHFEERDGKKIRVVDQHPKAAWDEYEKYGVYHLFPEIEVETQPTTEERLAALEEENAQLKEALDLLLSGATEEEVVVDG